MYPILSMPDVDVCQRKDPAIEDWEPSCNRSTRRFDVPEGALKHSLTTPERPTLSERPYHGVGANEHERRHSLLRLRMQVHGVVGTFLSTCQRWARRSRLLPKWLLSDEFWTSTGV